MESKKYLYAAVGAPVASVKRAQSRLEETRAKIQSSRKTLTSDLQKQVDEWAAEGEGFVSRIGDSKAIDELNERVDFDQVQEQVSKLRDQLEDLLDTWRANFRPAAKTAKISEKVEVEAPKAEAKPAAKATAAKKPAAKTTASKTTAAKKPAAKKPAAKTTAAKTAASKTTAAKAS